MQPQLTVAHGNLNVHVLGILKHAMAYHRPMYHMLAKHAMAYDWPMYHMLALLHSPDGRMKRLQRCALMESADIVLSRPCLMEQAK